MSSIPTTAIVVPCYNEAARLNVEAFTRFSGQNPSVRFVFVDDGSSDDTRSVLHSLCDRLGPAAEALSLDQNRGKAEAVRRGMQHAFTGDSALAGYWDADLATPLDEIPRFANTLQTHAQRLIVFGARVQLLGRDIERQPARHYLGRVFATAASMMLALPVYDTQCGAKLFRIEPRTRALFSEPFIFNWTFDVEVVARLIAIERAAGRGDASDLIYELPLERWIDVAGSNVRPSDFPRALLQLRRIRRHYLTGKWQPALSQDASAPVPAPTAADTRHTN